jgi:nucleotide-binding universal stress UspA family protein
MKEVKTILVAIDFSAMAQEALKRAISIAEDKDAQLIVIHVIEPPFIESPFLKLVDKDEIKQELENNIDELNAEANVKYVLFVESGLAVDTIVCKTETTKTNLLVIGTHGKDDIRSNYFGTTALKLVQKTHIPVLIVKNEVNNSYQKMLAPTNLTDYSKKSILFANALFSKSAVKYLYAFESVDELQALRYHISTEQMNEFKMELLFDAKTALEKFVKEVGGGEKGLIHFEASINEDILGYLIKDKADLLVLGSKGVNNLNSFLFGSTASYLIQRSPIDVLAYVPTMTDK